MYWHLGERINKDVLHDRSTKYDKDIVSTLSAQLMDDPTFYIGFCFNSRSFTSGSQLTADSLV